MFSFSLRNCKQNFLKADLKKKQKVSNLAETIFCKTFRISFWNILRRYRIFQKLINKSVFPHPHQSNLSKRTKFTDINGNSICTETDFSPTIYICKGSEFNGIPSPISCVTWWSTADRKLPSNIEKSRTGSRASRCANIYFRHRDASFSRRHKSAYAVWHCALRD